MNFNKIISFTFFFLFLTSVSPTLLSHHSFSHFYDVFTQMEGTLIEVKWKNPHVSFMVETVDVNGEAKLWEMETGTIYMIGRAGVTRDLFTEGDRIRVAGHTSSIYPNKFHLKNVLTPNGDEIITVANSPAIWTDNAIGGRQQWSDEPLYDNDDTSKGEGIFKVWSPPAVITGGTLFDSENSLSDSVNDSSEFAPTLPEPLESLLTERSIKSRDAWDAYDFDKNCSIPGMPRNNFGPHPHQFIDQGDQIIIISGEFNTPRTVYLNSDLSTELQAFSPMGFSKGYWKNENTLVVNTSRINFPYLNLSGAGQSNLVTIEEVYVVNMEGSRVDYSVIVDDPLMLKRPWVFNGFWIDLNERISIYDCEVNG